MSSKISLEQWREAQARWEADPNLSLLEIAKRLGVSAPSVTVYAQRHGWAKLVPSTPTHEELVQATVDVLGHISQRDELLDAASTALDLSVATRVGVINRQRNDWAEHRRLFPHEALAGDPTAARRAKLAAEAIAIRQRGEAVAFGLSTFSGRDTDAPLVEEVPIDQPSTPWRELMEAYRLTGKAPDAFHVPLHQRRITHQPESDPSDEGPIQ